MKKPKVCHACGEPIKGTPKYLWPVKGLGLKGVHVHNEPECISKVDWQIEEAIKGAVR